MKLVKWTDKDGFNHLSLLRESDPDDLAPSGIMQSPPDLRGLDWAAIVRELHNLLVDRGLITWKDVQVSQNGINSALMTVLKNKIINLYKLQEVKKDG
ncbi:MAG: hypothetical protein ACYTDW_19690 [Planctomycetota bacterium]